MLNRDKTQPNQAKAQTAIPRWRGFNLLEMFTMRSRGDFVEDDFKWMRDWGFDFVRLPTVYRLWIEDGDDYKIKESMLAKLDRGIDLANQYGLHVSLNFHRGAGLLGQRGVQGAAQPLEGQVALGRLLLPLAIDGQAVQGHRRGTSSASIWSTSRRRSARS